MVDASDKAVGGVMQQYAISCTTRNLHLYPVLCNNCGILSPAYVLFYLLIITKQKPFIFRDLATCTHVFVRTDSVRTSLQPPYEGPYPVIKRYAKYFDISIKGVSRTISIDRLKSCFFADPDPYKPTLVNNSSTTSTSPSTVSATPHHSQQSTSEQSSKLRVRFAEPPAQFVTRSGRAVHPSKRFL
ncbi:transposon Tf2-6 polyprotein [Trichonephila clavata]|uniref:Transposon Tf2-6 polyprotein n=1 Tax=Trichonephila clavata TaxID=2740835 RepID=A0A8X6G5V7_TRICU|nr:transposon Tf2-6 polyprotein [Trichonephila clavata]